MYSPKKLKDACLYCPKHIDPQNDKVTTDCTVSHGTPCPACTRQMQLRAQIEETKKILDKLIAEEHQARMEMNNYHHPLNRLPVEIISHIFCFTVPEFQLQEENEMPRSEPGALVLGAVCHAWREIAWSTPQLWSTIMLSLDWEPTDNKNHVVKEWLERSHELPLSIRLCLSLESVWLLDDRGYEEESSHARWFIDLFLDHSSRWQDLSVQCPHECVFDHFDEDWGSGSPHGLRTLQLIYPSAPMGSAKFLPSGAKLQPEHVVLSGFSEFRYLGICWKNATNVTINCLQIADFLRLVQGAPKLVHLTIENIDGSTHNVSIPNPPVALPHLQTFYISTRFHINFILDVIKLPLLEKLSILGITDYCRSAPDRRGLGPFSSIIQLFERSSCPLTSFILRHGACEDKDILDLLNALPSTVKTLELDLRHPDPCLDLSLPVLFGHLSRISTATHNTPMGSGLLPDLETFKYFILERDHTRIPWHLLPSIARPVFGEKRQLKKLSICLRHTYFSGSLSRMLEDIDEDVIRDLISLNEDGVELYVVNSLVSRENLLDVLEPGNISHLEAL